MEIIIKTYNLKQIRNRVINTCIDNNPTENIDDIAKKLGISVRTVQRFIGKTRKIKRMKQCREGNHRPVPDPLTDGYCCLKCGISTTLTKKK